MGFWPWRCCGVGTRLPSSYSSKSDGTEYYGEDASLCWCTHSQQSAFCPLTVSRGSRVVRELKLGRRFAQWHRGVKPRLGRDGCHFVCGWTMMVPA